MDKSYKCARNVFPKIGNRMCAKPLPYYVIVPPTGYFKGAAVLEEGEVYDGEWTDSLPHGQGVSRKDGVVRSGTWRYGEMNGACEVKWSGGVRKGSTFKGEMRDGKMTHGVYTNKDRELYFNGGFNRNGMYDGEDCVYKKRNLSYRGGFKKGVYHGLGVLTNDHGRKYAGIYTDGTLKEGIGSITFSNGRVWEGDFDVHGKPGIPYFKDIVPPRGLYKEGKKSFLRTDYGYYKGSWKDQRPHGKGEMYYPSGGYYIGKFKNGKRTKSGELRLSDKSTYVGGFKRDVMHGEGKHTFLDGSYYEGSYVEGKRAGHAVWYNAKSKFRYTGMFNVKGEYSGSGFVEFGNGFSWRGRFETGTPVSLPHIKDIVPLSGVFGPCTVCISGDHSAKEDYRMYHGKFKDRKYHGEGQILWLQSGKWSEGIFVNGRKSN